MYTYDRLLLNALFYYTYTPAMAQPLNIHILVGSPVRYYLLPGAAALQEDENDCASLRLRTLKCAAYGPCVFSNRLAPRCVFGQYGPSYSK